MKYVDFIFKVYTDYMKQADCFSFSEFMFQHLYNGPAYLAYVGICRLPGYTCLLLQQTSSRKFVSKRP